MLAVGLVNTRISTGYYAQKSLGSLASTPQESRFTVDQYSNSSTCLRFIL